MTSSADIHEESFSNLMKKFINLINPLWFVVYSFYPTGFEHLSYKNVQINSTKYLKTDDYLFTQSIIYFSGLICEIGSKETRRNYKPVVLKSFKC